jgi:N-acylglucosamine 2-epimerase
MAIKEYIKECAASYKKDLEEDIMPFWLNHGLDKEHGGVYTCLNRDGSIIDTTKSVWFQGRFGFVSAFAYNNVEHRQEWLDASKSCIDFIEKYCFDEQGHMYFEIAADGTPLRKRRYVFSESFAAIAMSEYSLATGDKSYAEKALAIFKRMQYFLSTPDLLPSKYEPSVKGLSHSITMILVNVAARIREVIKDPALDKQIDDSIETIRNKFMHPEWKALLESVGPNGEFLDTCTGRTINPGHCIETSWFLMEEAKYRNWDKNIMDTALKILDWSWAWGWDDMYGGIINFP